MVDVKIAGLTAVCLEPRSNTAEEQCAQPWLLFQINNYIFVFHSRKMGRDVLFKHTVVLNSACAKCL